MDYFTLMAFKYLVNSFLTSGNKNNNPIMFGKTNASIIASLKSKIDPIEAEEPRTTKTKNSILNIRSERLLLPNKYFHD